MAGPNKLAIKYARGFFDLLGEQKQKEGQKQLMAMSALKSLFALNEAKKVLVSPVMPNQFKLELLEHALAEGKADELLRSFVHNVLDAGRLSLLPEIIASYEELLDQASGRLKAELITAVELKHDEVESLRQQLELALKAKVDVATQVDPAILGGFVVRIGHKLIDLSLKTKLDTLTKSAAL